MIDPTTFDIVVVGAGPAGLSAGIHAAFEGLQVCLWEAGHVGGQSVTTSFIMNYPGFPTPISGHDLTQRMYQQYMGFKGKAHFIEDRAVHLFTMKDGRIAIEGNVHTTIAKKVLIATGLTFKHNPLIPSYHNVFYGPSIDMHPHMTHKDVCIIGGANSAGQAAINLFSHHSNVAIATHHASLRETMSSYLVDTIEKLGIEVLTNCELSACKRKSYHAPIELSFDSPLGERHLDVNGVFVCIGQQPDSAWIDVKKDAHGVIVVDENYQTSIPNVYAVGDIITPVKGAHRVVKAAGRASEAIAAMIREG